MKAIINPDTQAELLDLVGKEEFRELVREASLEFQEMAAPLKTVLHSGDWDQARLLSHKLKGILGALGYEWLYSNLHALEQQLREQPPRPPLQAQILEIFQGMDDTASAMKTFLN